MIPTFRQCYATLLFPLRAVFIIISPITIRTNEVFDSSLDINGTDDFLKIIRYIVKDANIFVISHKSEMHDKFENVIQFDKVKGFSRVV